MKATDMQAAIGCAQLEKLSDFTRLRREHFCILMERLMKINEHLILPEAESHSKPSWFGFLLTCGSGIRKDRIVSHLESKGIQTRMLFAGNIVKQPCFDTMRMDGKGYRIVGDLKNTNRIMRDTFWVGVYPGMEKEMLFYMADAVIEAVESEVCH